MGELQYSWRGIGGLRFGKRETGALRLGSARWERCGLLSASWERFGSVNSRAKGCPSYSDTCWGINRVFAGVLGRRA